MSATEASIGEWLEQRRVQLDEARSEQIIGIGHVLREVASLVGRLQHPDLVEAAGAEMPRGILFYGPPGTGKTLTARYLARQLGNEVPLFEVASDEVTPDRARGMLHYLGAAHPRCVLYLDEIDGFALDRTDQLGSPETRAVLVAFLAGLDGLVSTPGVVVIGSSNRPPMALDAALLRAGRLGFHVEFTVPDEGERLALFEHYAASRSTDGSIDFQRLTELSRGVTPADVRQFFDDALGLALADDRRAVREADLLDAVRRRGQIIPEVETLPADRHRSAMHEAAHAVVAAVLTGIDEVYAVRLEPDGGHTETGQDRRDNSSLPLAAIVQHLVIGHAGYAAEELLLGGATLGVREDLARLTELQLAMLNAGLEPAFPPLAADRLGYDLYGSLGLAWAEVLRARSAQARADAVRLVLEYRAAITTFAAVLEERGELSGGELRAALRAAIGPA